MPKISLLSDQALGESIVEPSDGLGFDTYARVLASAALDTRGPFTIGIFGEWGTGKTSIMRLVQKRLGSEPKVITVWFNAWRYEQEEHPIVPLVATIVRELERHRPLMNRLKSGGQVLMRALRAVAYGFSAKSKVKVPGFAEIEASFVAKDMIERDEKLSPDPLLDRSLYYQAFEALSAVKLDEEFRIVVLIDDLDRCFPDQAIRLLESIKLVLSQPGFIFLLGVARQVIEGYLQHRYSSDFGIADFQGQLYLDKIIQLPFFIPSNSGRMDRFCDVMIGRLEPSVRPQLKDLLPTIGEAFGGNPRAIIRFINNILIDLAINTELADSSETAIPVEFFAVSRCLQQRWPSVFSVLMGSIEISEEVAQWDRAAMRTGSNSGEPSRAEVARALLSDRNLETLLLGRAGKAWLTEPEARSASVNFLRTQQRISPRENEEVVRRYDVFMSFAKEDSGAVSRIAEILADSGLRVFMDKDLRLGTDWRVEIERALGGAKAACVCVGPGARLSEWRKREVDMALELAAGSSVFRLIPILLPGAETSGIPPFLSTRQWLDLRDGISSEKLRALVDALR